MNLLVHWCKIFLVLAQNVNGVPGIVLDLHLLNLISLFGRLGCKVPKTLLLEVSGSAVRLGTREARNGCILYHPALLLHFAFIGLRMM